MNCMNRVVLATFGLALSLTTGAASADVVAVVSANSTIMTLSKSEVTDIFLGRVSRFPDGAQAVPIDQAEGSVVRDQFYAKVVGKSPAQVKAFWSKIIFTGRGQPPKAVPNSIEMKKRIVENPAAIGYIEEQLVDNTVRVVL
jgi:ABC-type phosphate transport system substrate-binding protein